MPLFTGNGHGKTVLALSVVALSLAVLRYFLQGWLEPLGVPVVVGSFLASVTVVLLAAVWLLFAGEGRAPDGRYWAAASWFAVLALWCELLVIAGILATEQTGARTYYQGPWEAVKANFRDAPDHAVGHTRGFFFRLAFLLLAGLVVYAVARRRRSTPR